MKSPEIGQLICSRQKPDTSFYEKMSRELLSLQATEQAKELEEWEPDFVAGLTDTLKEIASVLERDRLSNLEKDLPCNFEYQIRRIEIPLDHLQVLTRLFKPGDVQSIFYGCFVSRLDKNMFSTWVSD